MSETISTQELADQAYELGLKYEKIYHGCSQCVLAAIMDVLGETDDNVFRAASGLGAGTGLSGRATCGALIGGVLAIGQRYGRQRDKFDDQERARFKAYKISRKLLERFEQEYGTNRCGEVQKTMMDCEFDLTDPVQWQHFESLGGHDTHCPTVVGNVARWTIEIIQEQEAIDKKRSK